MLKKVSVSLCLIILAITTIHSQDAQPDRWRGFVIDDATPQGVIEVMGKPSSDKIDRLRVFDVDSKWVTKRIEQKIYRKLEYKPADLKGATLSFLDDRLVMIELLLKDEVAASALSRIYGIDFLPRISGVDLAIKPRDYERREGRIYPKTYPSVFSVVGVTDRVFVGGLVGNTAFGKVLRESVGIPDAGAMPGKVVRVQIVSRRLENKDGAEALKE
jgi:hypothetical protein